MKELAIRWEIAFIYWSGRHSEDSGRDETTGW
jgi:hypothetical protein